jgi:Lrp/AsnC family leucine-responsive transcriptional regulator
MLDKTNAKIIRALTQNARISVSELAKIVHLSAPAVSERLRKLEESGVIEGYKPVINLEKCGFPISALIECDVHKAQERNLKEQLIQLDQIVKIYNVTGETTFIVWVAVRNLSELDAIIEQLIDYCDTTTKMIMSAPFNDAIPQKMEEILGEWKAQN